MEVLTHAGVPAGGATVAWKVFGPSIVALGSNLGKWTDRWSTNFLRISERAHEMLGDAADDEGEVPPRIVQRVVTDGAWCDDAVAQEYFAGLVADSRSKDGQDDSNLPIISLISRLATQDLRGHYAIYAAIRVGLRGGWKLGSSTGRNAATVCIPMESFASALGADIARAVEVAPNILATLAREGLIENHWASGSAKGLQKMSRREWDPPAFGIAARPSWAGIQLAIKADGPGRLPTADMLYGGGWRAIPEIVIPEDECTFVDAPEGWEQLEKLRESVGHVAGWPNEDFGWALPRPPVAEDT